MLKEKHIKKLFKHPIIVVEAFNTVNDPEANNVNMYIFNKDWPYEVYPTAVADLLRFIAREYKVPLNNLVHDTITELGAPDAPTREH